MPDFLITFHVPANAGYAVEPLEKTIFGVLSEFLATRHTSSRIHLGYSNFSAGKPRWLSDDEVPLLELDYRKMSAEQSEALEHYLKRNSVKYVLAFDLSVGTPICQTFRRAGVEAIISYWGAPLSAINTGIKLLAKRIEMLFIRTKPSHFIFESYGMQRTATHGRGVSKCDTSVVKPGIDIERFTKQSDKSYIYRQLSIPPERKVLFFAGHMEQRKGVHVIIKAAAELINVRRHKDLHFVLCGDQPGEKDVFDGLYKGTIAERYITFGGYRNDIPQLLPGCYAGIIASTEWDSFTFSSMEMAAARIPLLISNLIGLNEAIVDQKTGLLFTPGDHIELADKIEYLVAHPYIRDEFGQNAFGRVKQEFTVEKQKAALLKVIESEIKA